MAVPARVVGGFVGALGTLFFAAILLNSGKLFMLGLAAVAIVATATEIHYQRRVTGRNDMGQTLRR